MATTAYTVSALKYRPKFFSEVLAQEHVTQTLKNSLKRSQIANAFLFVGPRGTGKTTTARLLAKALNCENLQEGEPCNQCDSCIAVNRGNHNDVLEVDAASNRGIEEIKALRESVRFTPGLGKYKVYVIDEVHMLTKEANNAFLKTLEEPPSHVRFILATTELHKILPTILSRCQRYQFRRIPTQIIVEHLTRIIDTQGDITFQDNTERDRILYQIAKKSEGGLRDALFSLDQLIAFCSGSLSLAEVEDALGSIDFETIEGFIRAILQNDVQTILNIIEDISNRGKEFAIFFKECLQHLRNLCVIKVAKDHTGFLDMPNDWIDQLQATAELTSIEQILYVTDILWEAEQRMRFFPNARLVMEMVAIKAAKAGQAIQIDDIIKSLSSMTNTSQLANVSTTPQAVQTQPIVNSPKPQDESLFNARSNNSSQTQASAPPTGAIQSNYSKAPPHSDEKPAQEKTQASTISETTSLSTLWNHFLHGLESNPLLAGALEDSQLLEMQDTILRIGIPKQHAYFMRTLEQARNRQTLTTLTEEAFGKKMQIVYEVRDDIQTKSHSEPEPTPTQASGPSRKELLDRVYQNKTFDKLTEMFPGRIVNITPMKENNA